MVLVLTALFNASNEGIDSNADFCVANDICAAGFGGGVTVGAAIAADSVPLWFSYK
ncbi:MAG: hypothetical protein HC862_03895 [Scytonema sp. RU_4_4]|nr:hypothetical protein [Scytonema sp. RU_4_4]NJR73837.1 hypothetical protein [Scytonema sp. CRU_2_7]